MGKQITITKSDVKSELHPYLWHNWLDYLDLPEDTTELTCEVIDSE